MRNNQNQYYYDEVYNTPQYKIDAINRERRLPKATIEQESEYIYAPTNLPTLPVPPNSKKDLQSTSSRKQTIEHVYDEDSINDGYSLATNSGPKTTKDRRVQKESDGEKNSGSPIKKQRRCCTKNCIIICLIVVILALGGLGGLFAYAMIIGKGILFSNISFHLKNIYRLFGNIFSYVNIQPQRFYTRSARDHFRNFYP